jgi:chromosome partitioning protein
MFRFKGSDNLHRIVVLNPKGGSGKTTLAFNLSGYIASTGRKVALVDMDRQGSSTRWLQNRPSELPHIHGISLNNLGPDANGDWCIVVPEDIDYAVIDAPAGLVGHQLTDYTCGAHATLIPVLPSDLDIHAASRLISDLLLVAQVSRRNGRLGVVANRVNERTVAYQQLTSFLNRLSIAVVGILRDTQNYAWAASSGLCIHEMQPSRVSKDLAQWETVTQWLERRLAMPLTPRDFLRPAETVTPKNGSELRTAILIPAAAAMALFVVSLLWWMAPNDVNIAIPVEPTVATESVLSAPDEPGEVVLPDESVRVDAADELRQKWRLSGILASADGAISMILSDRHEKTSRRLSTEDDLDGWSVVATGSNYAVFSQKDEEVRLVLGEEATR